MAVPKKKMSKSRKLSRKSFWRNKIIKSVKRALSLGRSSSTCMSNIVYVP